MLLEFFVLLILHFRILALTVGGSVSVVRLRSPTLDVFDLSCRAAFGAHESVMRGTLRVGTPIDLR